MTSSPFANVTLPPVLQNFVDLLNKKRAEALDEGRAAGRAAERAAAILDLLELRGVPVSDAVRGEVLACRDLPVLEHWFRRAAKMKSAEAVIRSRPKATPRQR